MSFMGKLLHYNGDSAINAGNEESWLRSDEMCMNITKSCLEREKTVWRQCVVFSKED